MGNNEKEIRENLIKALMLSQVASLIEFINHIAETETEIDVANDMLIETYEEMERRFGKDWGLAKA